jgi:hypothetical protein
MTQSLVACRGESAVFLMDNEYVIGIEGGVFITYCTGGIGRAVVNHYQLDVLLEIQRLIQETFYRFVNKLLDAVY